MDCIFIQEYSVQEELPESETGIYRIENRSVSVDYTINVLPDNLVTDNIYHKFLTKQFEKKYSSSEVEIMFTNTTGILLKNNQVKGVPINTFISIKNINHELKACFFLWYQKPEVGKSCIKISNVVDNQTDFVLSNLPQPVFNKLVYSTDNLAYNYVETDSLFIDEYHQTDLDFYGNIYCALSNLGGAYFYNFESKHKKKIENEKK